MRNGVYRFFIFIIASALVATAAPAQVTDGTGCTAPVSSAANSGPYSEGTIIVLSTNSIDGATYQWTGPAGFTSSLQNPMISSASVGNAGSYAVAVTNGCGTANATTNVTVYPRPMISIDNVIAKAPPRGASGTFTFHVTLSNPSSMPVSVQVFTSNQTAYAGRDYVTTVNTLVFEPGTTEQNVTVTVMGTGSRSQRQFLVNLTNPVNSTIAVAYGFQVRGTGVIQP